ncbi:MAG: hypothetical protein ABI557_17550 [Aureliella sp.]
MLGAEVEIDRLWKQGMYSVTPMLTVRRRIQKDPGPVDNRASYHRRKKILRLLIDKARTALYTMTKFTQNALLSCGLRPTPKHKKILSFQSDS